LEDQDTTKGIEECAQISVERIPAEAQLRNDCENLWQELNSVSSARTGQWCCISYSSLLHLCCIFICEIFKLNIFEATILHCFLVN